MLQRELEYYGKILLCQCMGPLDWQKPRESCFIFKNQVVVNVLIFLSCPKSIFDWICKNMPCMLQDWQSGLFPDRAQLVGEHPVFGGWLTVQSSRLKRGRKTLVAKVKSITRLKASLADENAEGLTSRLVPCMQLSHQPIQGWVPNGSVWKALGVGRVGYWNPCLTSFFLWGLKGLVLFSWLTACIPGLVVVIGSWLVPCHFSHWANTPWLEGGWVPKTCLWGRGLYWHCKKPMARFSLEGRHVSFDYD